MLDNVRLQSELQPGETLEWTGKPHPWRVFTARDWFLIPFSLLWSGLVLSGAAQVLSPDVPLFVKLFFLPFILVGLYVVFGRFLVNAWDLRHTWYGVTNQRIIILTTTFGHRVQSFYFNTMPEIETTISASGRGTLRFGPPSYRWSGGWAIWGTRSGQAPGFYDIPDARYVFDLISRHRHTSQ